jgi:nucleotidyltransferase/DNA polymerase involved in DNA repair
MGTNTNSAVVDSRRVKVSLERYRRASVSIFKLIKRFAKQFGAVFQRASIDEAYLDITAL